MAGEAGQPPASSRSPIGRVAKEGGAASRWLGRWGVALGAAIPIVLDPESSAVRDAVLARIEEARAAAAARPEGQRLAELLRRAASSFTALRAMAARLLDASLGFRDATVTESEVVALLEDPVATAEQRIAAAIALAAQKESGKARVRVAAAACASPKLCVALDAAAARTLDDARRAAAEEQAGTARRAATREE